MFAFIHRSYLGGSEGTTDTDEKNIIVERWTGDGGQWDGRSGKRRGGGGSYVNLFAKGINARGQGGGEEGWREGIEARDGGRRQPLRNLRAFETFAP